MIKIRLKEGNEIYLSSPRLNVRVSGSTKLDFQSLFSNSFSGLLLCSAKQDKIKTNESSFSFPFLFPYF